MKKKKEGKRGISHAISGLFILIGVWTVMTVAALLLGRLDVGKENLLMLFLVGVLLCTALTNSWWYGILSALFSAFLFNYFFTEPKYTLLMNDPQDFILLFFFLLVSLICGLMSTMMKRQQKLAKKNAAVSQKLYEITESFLKLSGIQKIIETSLNDLYQNTGVACKLELTTEFLEIFREETTLERTYIMPKERSWQVFHGKEIPITGISHKMGTLYFAKNIKLDESTEKIVNAIIYQMTLLFDRECIYREREQIRLEMESEHLKTTLLRSVSHDLRTPLTGIMGSANLLSESFKSDAKHPLSMENARQLVDNILEEANWLNMSVQNILNMTRISDGKLMIRAEYESVDDLLNQVEERLPITYDRSRLTIQAPEEICLVKVDGNLFVQVLLNLLDNAYRYAGDEAHILLSAVLQGKMMVFLVKDDGPGIDASVQEHIFDGFVTGKTHASDKGRGVGLGLTICKAIVEAQEGQITAANDPKGGAVFRIFLPCEKANLPE
ncbi:MAG: DUF4118 domain-containing protein [Lachnospiraceae bacterium]